MKLTFANTKIQVTYHNMYIRIGYHSGSTSNDHQMIHPMNRHDTDQKYPDASQQSIIDDQNIYKGFKIWGLQSW